MESSTSGRRSGPGRQRKKSIGYWFVMSAIQSHKTTLTWFRLRIPNKAIKRMVQEKLEESSEEVDILHVHDHSNSNSWRFVEYEDPDKSIFGPFASDIPKAATTQAVGSVVYCAGGDTEDFPYDKLQFISRELSGIYDFPRPFTDDYNDYTNLNGFCLRPRSCDFSPLANNNNNNNELSWEIGMPFNSPRLRPKLFTFMGKLYAFGGNYPSMDAPFAEVFDPVNGCWEIDTTFNSFVRLSENDMVVTTLYDHHGDWVNHHGDWPKILFYNKRSGINSVFCTFSKKWDCTCKTCSACSDIDPKIAPPFYGANSIVNPVVVQKLCAVYWLDEEYRIHAFDWTNSQLFSGTIPGSLSHESPFRFLPHYRFSLFHLKDDVFTLIWVSLRSDDSFTIHLSILQVLKERQLSDPTDHNSIHGYLRVKLLGCFCYCFGGFYNMQDVHRLL